LKDKKMVRMVRTTREDCSAAWIRPRLYPASLASCSKRLVDTLDEFARAPLAYQKSRRNRFRMGINKQFYSFRLPILYASEHSLK
jgi:hypothetical protein